jgi:hypothetical protein
VPSSPDPRLETTYQIGDDGSGFLLARFTDYGTGGELYLAPLDGGSPLRLATDLMDYRMYSMPVRAFAFTPPSKRVLYIVDTSGDAGRSYGIASVSRDGSDHVQLTSGSSQAVVSSYADRVAFIAVDTTLGCGTISVVSSTGASQFSTDVTGSVMYASFVPHDRGFLFVEEPTGANKRLRHLSFASSNVTTLGEWTTAVWRFPPIPSAFLPAAILSTPMGASPSLTATSIRQEHVWSQCPTERPRLRLVRPALDE